MAKITISIETAATGPLEIFRDLTEDHAQRILAAQTGRAAPVTDTREIDDPANPGAKIIETFERPRRTGEALTDRANLFFGEVARETSEWEAQTLAADALAKAPAPIAFGGA